MAYFSSSDGNLTDVFLTEYDLIDSSMAGTIYVTGSPGEGSFGDNGSTSFNRSTHMQNVGGAVWTQVTGADRFIAGIRFDGSLWTWGSNAYGQLGDNALISVSSPVQTISRGTDWKKVQAGGSTFENFCLAIKTNGTLWTWGYNNFGQLGDNTATNKSSPVQTVAGGNNWKQVSAGTHFAAGLKTDGTLWMWGRNDSGQLGDNTVVEKSSPVQTISGGTNWAKLPASSGGSTFFNAIKTDGTLWTWGGNAVGQLGDNTIVFKSSPIQTVAGGNNWVQSSCGSLTPAGIKNDGTLWIWGRGNTGMLGDNTTVNKSSPVQTVAGGNNWKYVVTGTTQSGLKTDGTLWHWGSGTSGTVGDGTIGNKSSPVQAITAGIFWIGVANGLNNIQRLGV
jgi:alpha-tubulin suppressor-like RCC1 family protein